MMHVSVMDTETWRMRRPSSAPGMKGDFRFSFFSFSVHQAKKKKQQQKKQGDEGRMKDHLLNLCREEEYLLKSDLRASS